MARQFGIIENIALKITEENKFFVLFYSRANDYLVDDVGLLFLLLLIAMMV